jgi:hypothetical protein
MADEEPPTDETVLDLLGTDAPRAQGSTAG